MSNLYDDDGGEWVGPLVGAAAIVFMILVAILGGCDLSPNDARRILAQDGVTDVVLSGYSWGACSRGELENQEFMGTKSGAPVSGYVCGDASGGMSIHYK